MTPSPSKVLVVDDREADRELISRQFGKAGCKVETANSGEEALEKLLSGRYDLVLLDLIMPHGGGIYVLSEMKKRDRTERVAVLTGHSDEAVQLQIKASELHPVLTTITKPIDKEKIDLLLRHLDRGL